jgi:hypothetical protein
MNSLVYRYENEAATVKNVSQILYHIGIVVVSAAAALSLPWAAGFLARKFLVYWSLIEHEKIFLVSVEITVAALLIFGLHAAGKSWQDRRLSRMARYAGMVSVTPVTGFFARRRARKLKEKEGFARDLKLIGSTGFRTFTDPQGDLHKVLLNCREAKIMLLDPLREGAAMRAKSIPDPDISPEILREQIIRSIDFLKGLKAAQKNIRLKLYPDMPLLKLAVLGDHVFLRYYHTGLNVRSLPEYAFKHDQNPGGLYSPFHQYFFMRWNDSAIPEYDLDTDELVYRDGNGNEVKREAFNEVVMAN